MFKCGESFKLCLHQSAERGKKKTHTHTHKCAASTSTTLSRNISNVCQIIGVKNGDYIVAHIGIYLKGLPRTW